jgi:ubiquinone/menaquinone biosynthesis C-methylase UbiE
MEDETLAYHSLELSIATNPQDPRRLLPPVSPSHRRILDVGCGAGQTLIACDFSETVMAVGVDVDHEALGMGRSVCPKIHFVMAQGEELPFANESFDLVICRVALPYMHVSRALSQMARVLRKGGDVWLTLHPFRMTARELAANVVRLNVKAAIYRSWVLINGVALHVVGRQGSWPLHPNRYETFQTQAAITRALRATGFKDIQVSKGTHFLVRARKA